MSADTLLEPPEGRVTLWLDGSFEGSVLAAWLTRCDRDWLAVIPDEVWRNPQRAEAIAKLLALMNRPARQIMAQAEPLALAGMLPCITATADLGANVVCLPARRDVSQPAQVARVKAINQLLAAWGFGALELPFWRATDHAIARLALAIDAPTIYACTCIDTTTCQPQRCTRWERMFRMLGLKNA